MPSIDRRSLEHWLAGSGGQAGSWDESAYDEFEPAVVDQGLCGAGAACSRLWPLLCSQASSNKEEEVPGAAMQWAHYARFICKIGRSENSLAETVISQSVSLLACENNRIRAIAPQVLKAIRPESMHTALSALAQYDGDIWNSDQKLSSKASLKLEVMRCSVAVVYVALASVGTSCASPTEYIRNNCLSMLTNVMSVVEHATETPNPLGVCVCKLASVLKFAQPEHSDLKCRLIQLLQFWCTSTDSEPSPKTPTARACSTILNEGLSLHDQVHRLS